MVTTTRDLNYDRVIKTTFITILVLVFILSVKDYKENKQKLNSIGEVKYTVEQEIPSIYVNKKTYVLLEDVRNFIDNKGVYEVTTLSDGKTYIDAYMVKVYLENIGKKLDYKEDKIQILKADRYSKQELEEREKLVGSLERETAIAMLKMIITVLCIAAYALRDTKLKEEDKYLDYLETITEVIALIMLIIFLIILKQQ